MQQLCLKNRLDSRPDLQHYLFRRGFLISRDPVDSMDRFPFYGNWNTKRLGGWHFLTHRDCTLHYFIGCEATFFLVGHSYNPFTMEHDETEQLKRIAAAYWEPGEMQSRIDELTGIFVLGWFDDAHFHFLTDPSGIQSAWYGEVEGNFMITSHAQLIGDLCNLPMSDLVKELLAYKWYYRVKGPYLPGDISQYEEVRRVVPDILFTYRPHGSAAERLTTRRFYPICELQACKTESEYDETIRAAADILKNGAELVLRKWNRPAISLTGGIDSNTTFAAANGHYAGFSTFSYLSAHKESIDVDAAKTIAAHFDVQHTVYRIPEENAELADYDVKAAILEHNNGYVAPQKANELRKRIYLEDHFAYDVEVKSWVSETIRAYWYKHFNRKKMPPLSAKLFRNLYKIFLTDRSLARKIDRLFADYIDRFEYHRIPAQYPPTDMFYSEVSMGSWGGVNVSEMKYCFDITVLYNNRKFLDLLFRVPLEKRISDQHHLDMKRYLNKELYDMNIRVVNMEETKRRAFLLNVIFTANTFLPF